MFFVFAACVSVPLVSILRYERNARTDGGGIETINEGDNMKSHPLKCRYNADTWANTKNQHFRFFFK